MNYNECLIFFQFLLYRNYIIDRNLLSQIFIDYIVIYIIYYIIYYLLK